MSKRYWKSTITGYIYEAPADYEPEYDGWAEVSEDEYIAFMREMGWFK